MTPRDILSPHSPWLMQSQRYPHTIHSPTEPKQQRRPRFSFIFLGKGRGKGGEGGRKGGKRERKTGINLRCSLKPRHPSHAATNPEHVRMKSKIVNDGARQTGDNNPVILQQDHEVKRRIYQARRRWLSIPGKEEKER